MNCWLYSDRSIPLLVRRGGCGINKKSAKPTLAPQTGRSLTRHVLKMHSEPWCVSDLPVRSYKGGFAIFYWCRVHPSSRGGDYIPQFIHTLSDLRCRTNSLSGHARLLLTGPLERFVDA